MITNATTVAAAKAKGQGISNTWFIPPGAEDFVGLIYQFLGKGKLGEQQLEFFNERLFKPFARATAEMNKVRQSYVNAYKALKEKYPNLKSKMLEKTSNLSYEQVKDFYEHFRANCSKNTDKSNEIDRLKIATSLKTFMLSKDPEPRPKRSI